MCERPLKDVCSFYVVPDIGRSSSVHILTFTTFSLRYHGLLLYNQMFLVDETEVDFPIRIQYSPNNHILKCNFIPKFIFHKN